MPERRVPARQKQIVAERAGGRCEYCRCPAAYTPDPFAIEHIHPRVRGGTNQLSNLALSCQGCNNRKHTNTSALDPTSGQQVALYHPRTDRWQEHFAWSEDGLLMVGLTPVGRATIAGLELNRSGVVNLRFALLAIGMHPPEREA